MCIVLLLNPDNAEPGDPGNTGSGNPHTAGPEQICDDDVVDIQSNDKRKNASARHESHYKDRSHSGNELAKQQIR